VTLGVITTCASCGRPLGWDTDDPEPEYTLGIWKNQMGEDLLAWCSKRCVKDSIPGLAARELA
jgi:hypothetical protein